MKKSLSRAYIVLFFVLLILPTVVFALFGDNFDQTNYEQRPLSEKPDLSAENLTEFPALYESYYNDHLPFRTQLIEANSLLNFHIFRHSAVSDSLIGRDGWLFYNPAGKDGDTIADYRGTNLFSDDDLQWFVNHLTTIRDELAAEGKEFVVLVIPNKESMYSSYLPEGNQPVSPYTRGDQVVNHLQQNTDLAVIYPKAELLEAMEQYPEYDFYYRTDSHWNNLGAYIGFKKFMEHWDVQLPGLEQLEITAKDGYSGDLVGMMGLTKYLKYDTEYILSPYSAENAPAADYPFIDKNYDEEAYNIKDGRDYVHFTAENGVDKEIFVARDSYGEALIPMISSHFAQTHIVHQRSYSPRLVQEADADIVVYEVVERYVPNLVYLLDIRKRY
ncbi:MAG: hypothetical protein IJN69_07435 [Oscillospiraceae bacterium]|nr:hypothetical protein [Oscillospiraceae bacterium]